MKAYVITIRGHADSERCADRCIASARKFGLKVEKFDAITPADDPAAMFKARGWPTEKFTGNRFSRPLPCMACFLSHSELWHQCAYSGESVLILEHDAVMVSPRSLLMPPDKLVNLGKPSFGGYRQPPFGIGPLYSKPFLPGAHAYWVHHYGASDLLAMAAKAAEPTDVFLSLKRFPFIREIYPWPFEAHDDVTTVQGPEGIRGKHNAVRIV